MQREQKLIKAFQQIELFNKLIGNKNSYEAVFNQLGRVEEELEETLDAVSIVGKDLRGNKVRTLSSEIDELELLDGVCDQLVVVLDLIAKLEALGYNVLDGLLAVTENNMSKFTKDDVIPYTTQGYYESIGTRAIITYDEEHKLFGVKRKQDGKLLKMVNFKPVDLKEFLPEGD